MIEELITALEQYGLKVYPQGSMSAEEEYPDTFLTFWNPDTQIVKYYDNTAVRSVWIFWIYVYSTSYTRVLSLMDQIQHDLRAQGYLIDSEGCDVASDLPTHTGRMISVSYLQTRRV